MPETRTPVEQGMRTIADYAEHLQICGKWERDYHGNGIEIIDERECTCGLEALLGSAVPPSAEPLVSELIVGDAKAGGVEVRYGEPAHKTLDEIVAYAADVHLEQMNDSQYCLIISTGKECAYFWINAKRGRISAMEYERESVHSLPSTLRRKGNDHA